VGGGTEKKGSPKKWPMTMSGAVVGFGQKISYTPDRAFEGRSIGNRGNGPSSTAKDSKKVGGVGGGGTPGITTGKRRRGGRKGESTEKFKADREGVGGGKEDNL